MTAADDPDAPVSSRRPGDWDVLLAIALGGVVGAEARYGLTRAVPPPEAAWPWATLLANVAGSALIGLLMSWVDATRAHRLARPLLGVGVLGGFTTFSTFGLDAYRLVQAHRPALALAYVGVSVLACLGAVAVADATGRRLFAWRQT